MEESLPWCPASWGWVTIVTMKQFLFFDSCILLGESILKDQLALNHDFRISLLICPSHEALEALGSFLAVVLGSRILEVLLPNYFLIMLRVYTAWCFNKVLEPEDSRPWGSWKLPKGCDSREHFRDTSFPAPVLGFLVAFLKFAFPEAGLHQFLRLPSCPTFLSSLPSSPFVREGPASCPPESFKVTFPRV